MKQDQNEQIIRETAYYLWLDAGKPFGQPDAFWYQAITQLSPKKPNTKISQNKRNRSR